MSLISFEVRRKNRDIIFISSDRVTLQILKSHPVTISYRPFEYNGDIKCNTNIHLVISENSKSNFGDAIFKVGNDESNFGNGKSNIYTPIVGNRNSKSIFENDRSIDFNAGVIDKNDKTTIKKRLKIKLLFYNLVGLTIYFAFEFFSVNSLKLSRIACQPFCWASIGWVFSASNDSSISVW